MASETNLFSSVELSWINRKQEFPHSYTHTVRSEAGVIVGSAPADEGGEAKKWDPIQMLLASVAQAHLVEFLKLASDNNLLINEYKDNPRASLVSHGDRNSLTKIDLEPRVWLHEPGRRTQADELHHEAVSRNPITSVLNIPLTVNPNLPPDQRQGPEFTSRLGAPITILKPTSSLPPSQVTGKPGTQQPVEDKATVKDESFFALVGGHATFKKLVDIFYDGVAQDPLLRPMYPEEDLGPAKWRLQSFLEQYWGGPKTYSEQRGHPRLRMRHIPFHVNPEARDRWLFHMRNAVDAIALPPLYENQLLDYLDRAAHSLVNQPE